MRIVKSFCIALKYLFYSCCLSFVSSRRVLSHCECMFAQAFFSAHFPDSIFHCFLKNIKSIFLSICSATRRKQEKRNEWKKCGNCVTMCGKLIKQNQTNLKVWRWSSWFVDRSSVNNSSFKTLFSSFWYSWCVSLAFYQFIRSTVVTSLPQHPQRHSEKKKGEEELLFLPSSQDWANEY